MAASISAATTRPWLRTVSGATTWTLIALPSWTTQVLVSCESVAGYAAFGSNGDPAAAESPADAGAVGTHKITIPSNNAIALPIPRDDGLVPIQTRLFIAAASATGTITVLAV